MKKIIVSIIVIGLISSTAPIIIGEEAAKEKMYKSSAPTISNSRSDSSILPAYVPGELIVKFKDDVNVCMSLSTISATETGITSQESSEGTSDLGGSSGFLNENTLDDIISLNSIRTVLNTGISSIDALNAEYGVYSEEKLIEDDSVSLLSNTYILKLPLDSDVLFIAEEYEEDQNIEFAEPNYVYQPCINPDMNHQSDQIFVKNQDFITNDPDFELQWGLHNTGQTNGTSDADIDAPEAWEVTNGSSDVVIAILDSGIDYMNPDIGNCTNGVVEEDFLFESPHPIIGPYNVTLDFPGCDKVALHFSEVKMERIGDGPRTQMYVLDPNHNPGIIDYFTAYNSFDVWTQFSQLGGSQIKIEVRGNCSGFKIDKIKKADWIKPSIQCPEKYVDGYDFVHNDQDPTDFVGHGTHCAGIAAAVTNNSIGIAGIAGNCKLMALEALGETPVVGDIFDDIRDKFFFNTVITFAYTLVRIIRGLVYAANHNADVVSMSIGFLPCMSLKAALSYANNKGVVLIAAAGNENTEKGIFLAIANHDDVFTVAATDHNDKKAGFSCYGTWVDAAAPGVGIYSTTPTHHFAYEGDMDQYFSNASGTSMACPHMAGVAGLILSKAKSQGLQLTPAEVKTILRSSTDPVITSKYIGTGRINAFTSLEKTAPVTAELGPSLDEKQIKRVFKMKGTATGPSKDFQNYVIEYSKGIYPDEDSWQQITFSSLSKTGVLGKWDTRTVEDGVYTLRLKVTSNDLTYIDRTFVIVDNEDNTYHVDDDNTGGPWLGTSEHPFRYIKDAIDICGSGDTVYVHSGNYYMDFPVILKSIKLKGENKETTIINKDYYDTTLVILGSLHISDFTINFNIGGLFSYGTTISKNKIKGSLDFYFSRQITISDNLISGDDFGGINLKGSHNNEIKKNTISKVNYGILIEKGRFNKIFNNDISNCKNNGIRIESEKSIGNLIYYNNFINNEKNAYDKGNNIWYKYKLIGKSKGNYWDDYDGEDADGDGIGDTPYNISGGDNRDLYPLMEQNENNVQNNNQQTSDENSEEY